MEQTREKTILTNVVEILATSIEFSSPIRVQLAALSDKSDTMEAFRRSHLPVVQTLCHIMLSWLLYHKNNIDGSIIMCWRERKINEQGFAEVHQLCERGRDKKNSANTSLLNKSKNTQKRVDLGTHITFP